MQRRVSSKIQLTASDSMVLHPPDIVKDVPKQRLVYQAILESLLFVVCTSDSQMKVRGYHI